MSDEINDPKTTTDEGATGAAPAKGGVRWSRVILAVSLALNLAVVGMVVGTALRHPDRGPTPRDGGEMTEARDGQGEGMRNRDVGFAPFIDAIEGKGRRALALEFMRQMGDRESARERVRVHFEQVVSTLRAEPFDAAAFAELITERQRDLAARQEIGAQLLAEHVAEMSEEDRAAYAERLEQILQRPPRKR
ncbi:periplasmic heavy metal sensor [Celeribacter sp.]|uniref:periplasmic heavy metal sensor n=1 Tax=Celeribacter sp. TaxID=1890673 RepID=UPI003A91AE9C